jgi:hypothetical protein
MGVVNWKLGRTWAGTKDAKTHHIIRDGRLDSGDSCATYGAWQVPGLWAHVWVGSTRYCESGTGDEPIELVVVQRRAGPGHES